MNIAIKVFFESKFFDHLQHPFHGVIRRLKNTRTEKQPLNIITPIKIHGQIHDFLHGKCSTLDVIGTARNTIGTVKNTDIREQNFQ